MVTYLNDKNQACPIFPQEKLTFVGKNEKPCCLSYVEWTKEECLWVLWAVNLSLNPQKTRFVKKTDVQYYKVQSKCPYFVFHSKTRRNFSTRNKCTNHLLVCPATALRDSGMEV